jgi:hypothetical protein
LPLGCAAFAPCPPPRPAALSSSGCDRAEGFARRGPLAVRMRPRQRHPTARRPLGTRSLRRNGRVTRGAEGRPHLPHPLNSVLWINFPVRRGCLCKALANGGGGPSAPRATGAIAPERAGPERPDRRVETLAPTKGLLRGRGIARIRTPGCAGSVARAGGQARADSLRPSAGGSGGQERPGGWEERTRDPPRIWPAGLDAQPERPLQARGARRNPPRSGKERRVPHPATAVPAK